MLLASIETIANMSVLLPMRAQLLLKCNWVFICSYILKFINADYDMNLSIFSDSFSQVQNFIRRPNNVLPLQTQFEFADGVSNEILGINLGR
jgi:hypothetical protein